MKLRAAGESTRKLRWLDGQAVWPLHWGGGGAERAVIPFPDWAVS